MTTEVDESPSPGAHPALKPPPILPWNDFDTTQVNDRSLAVQLVAEILMDDEWHDREEVIAEVMWELELPRKSVVKMLGYFKAHGDIRQDQEWIRLTTRWRGWTS